MIFTYCSCYTLIVMRKWMYNFSFGSKGHNCYIFLQAVLLCHSFYSCKRVLHNKVGHISAALLWRNLQFISYLLVEQGDNTICSFKIKSLAIFSPITIGLCVAYIYQQKVGIELLLCIPGIHMHIYHWQTWKQYLWVAGMLLLAWFHSCPNTEWYQ